MNTHRLKVTEDFMQSASDFRPVGNAFQLVTNPIPGGLQFNFEEEMKRNGWNGGALAICICGGRYLNEDVQDLFIQYKNSFKIYASSVEFISSTQQPTKEAKMITTEQLNKVAEIIGTNDKNVVIAVVLKTLIDNGMGVAEAYEEVFGAGSYQKLTGQVWEALQK